MRFDYESAMFHVKHPYLTEVSMENKKVEHKTEMPYVGNSLYRVTCSCGFDTVAARYGQCLDAYNRHRLNNGGAMLDSVLRPEPDSATLDIRYKAACLATDLLMTETVYHRTFPQLVDWFTHYLRTGIFSEDA